MRKSIIIASLEFPTLKAAKGFFRTMRDRYADGERIPNPDDAHLRGLIAVHPEAAMKTGVGISHFSVDRDQEFGTTRHFVIHRIDGSSTDVSFHSAIDGRNERRDRYEALRRAVEQQIVDFRTSVFAEGAVVTCPFHGVPLAPGSCHVDHEPPGTFLGLADQWLAAAGLALMDLEITPPADNQVVTKLTNAMQITDWQEFHRQHAKLRILSPLGNLSDAKLTAKSTRVQQRPCRGNPTMLDIRS